MEINIRLAEPNDYAAIENLTREAFWNLSIPGCIEHYVVHQMHETGDSLPELEFVAEVEGRIVGHVIYGHARIEGEPLEGLLYMGPISVDPPLQRRGIGSALVRKSLYQARVHHHPAVFAKGNPDFYKRFGFVSAAVFGIYMENRHELEPFFLVKELRRNAVNGFIGKFCPDQFHVPQMEQVEAFDQKFPPKEKKALQEME